jgi:hypothetical protein
MATLSKLKPGDVLWDVHSYKMGNTTMSTMGCWPVRIVEVHETYVMASWNGNPPERMNSMRIQRYRVSEPVMIREGFGRSRLATRAELKAMKEKGDGQER